MRRIRVQVTVTVVAVAVAASLAGVGVSLWAVAEAGRPLLNPGLSGAVVLGFAVVGAVVLAARPRNMVGRLMLAGSVLWSLGSAGADLAVLGLVADPGRVPGASFYAVAGSAARSCGWFVVTLGVPLFFPDGRLRGRPARWIACMLVVVVTGAAADPLTDPRADLRDLSGWRNPIAPSGAVGILRELAFVSSVPLSVLTTAGVVAVLITRWRRGNAFARQQLAILAGAVGTAVLAAPLAYLTGADWLFSAAALPVPFAIGFAVLARDIYDLRTAVNRTVVWITLSGLVVAIYALVIAGVGALLHVGDARWLPWVGAVVVALVFAPLRDALQRAVNRLTFGRWDEPYDVLAALGQRLEGSADVDRLLTDVATELRGLGLQEVVICDEHGHPVAGEPGPARDAVTLALTAYGRRVGTLRYGRPDPPLRPRDVRLLDDLAGHLGGVLHARRLTAEVQRARESLVLAREEERRRLRRDLHDGLGPALAGHLLRLDVLAERLHPGSDARADVDALRIDLRATVLEVRRVVEGLRPPALDELGLAGALERVTDRLTAGTATVADLRMGNLPALPAAVEVATFRIVTEAVTNVARHAHAAHCDVRIDAVGRGLRIVVVDDGCGIAGNARSLAGHGLQTMRERVEELRGRFEVTATGGTTVVAEIPLLAGPGTAARTPALVGGP